MIFSILNEQGTIQKRLSAASLDEACQAWARSCWEDAVADEAVIQAPRYNLKGQAQAVFLDPYLVTPEGTEQECLAWHHERLVEDPHFAPDPALSGAPRTIDTGGRG